MSGASNRGFEVRVAAIIVTRGDQDLTPVLASLPEEWEVLVWDNSRERDLSVYGRYAAIERTDAELIYVQDDDCVVSDPQAIVDAWMNVDGGRGWRDEHGNRTSRVVCNMPQEFRHDFYSEHALVGFGACFHRDAPARAWWRLRGGFDETSPWVDFNMDWFHRTCDIVFTALTPRVLVDVPVESLPWAHYETRMWKQPGHVAERVRMLDLVRSIA